MKSFTYERADTLARATTALAKPGTKVIAGGTNLLDLMKLQVESPSQLVDINRLPLDKIEDTPDGGPRFVVWSSPLKSLEFVTVRAASHACP